MATGTPYMRSVCAWCQAEGKARPPSKHELVTHGICREHMAQELAAAQLLATEEGKRSLRPLTSYDVAI